MATTPTLNSFTSPNSFNTETATVPLYAGILAGSTYVSPVFSGVSGAASNNPGGLFGWLIYSRSQIANPAKGFTYDSYVVYTRPDELINDLNNLKGVTACLLSNLAEQGGTYGFFFAYDNTLVGLTNGKDFLYALDYLAYGGTLIIAGATAGFVSYENTTTNYIDILIGQNGSTAQVRYIEESPQIIGIFPSVNDGAGYTALNFDQLFSSSTLVSGLTTADRIFSVAGKNTKDIDTTSLKTGSTLKDSLSLVSQAAGAFVRAKNNNTLYFSVAGKTNSTVLNGTVPFPVNWDKSSEKDLYKKNRVNFYTYSDQSTFLGLDLVGATMSSSASYTANDRIGPSKLRQDIETQTKEILMRYIYQTNNATTRAAITSEINLYLFGLNQYIDPTQTLVTCDGNNNTDLSSTINVDIIVKPLVASDAFVLNISTQA